MHTVPDLDANLDEPGLQRVVLVTAHAKRQVVERPFLPLSVRRKVAVRLGRRDELEPELVAIELEGRLHVGDPQHDLGESFDSAHAATPVTIAARLVSRTRGGTEQPGAMSNPRPPVSSIALRASASILAGGP